MDRTSTVRCPRCHGEFSRSEVVLLWDGVNYCRPCIDRHSKSLLAYSDHHPSLIDTLQPREMVFARDVALTLFVLSSAVLILVWFVLPELFMKACLFASGFALFYATPVLLAPLLEYPQTVTISNGMVVIKSRLYTQSTRLADCDWDVNAMMIPHLLVFRYTPAIYLYFGRGIRQRSVVTCLDDETREIWTAFLTFTALDPSNLPVR